MLKAHVPDKDLSDLDHQWQLPIRKNLFLNVYVWKSTVGLFRNTNFKNKDYLGAYVGYPHPRQKGLFGEIHLVRSEIGAGYVAHEIQHFILDYMIYYNLSPHRSNEKIAYMASNITTEFWNKFYDFYEVKPGIVAQTDEP